jgi:hypothetical protein
MLNGRRSARRMFEVREQQQQQRQQQGLFCVVRTLVITSAIALVSTKYMPI